MIPTTAYIHEKFDEFNHLMFEGKLPRVPVRITRARSYLGLLSYTVKRNLFGKKLYSDFLLSVSAVRDLPENVIDDTVIHEMIHLYIHHNGYGDTGAHGRLFRGMMDRINRSFNRNITVKHEVTEEEKRSDRQIRAHYICRLRLATGQTAVVVSQKSAVLNLWNEIECSRLVSDFRWFGSINPFFNRYTRSRVFRKYYLSNDEELDRELRDAYPLEREGDIVRVIQDNRRLRK